MICPVEIASDMSAFRAVVGDHARHELLHTSRHGAGYESTGSDVAGDGEEDQLVASGGDPGHQRPTYAALAGALRGVRIPRVVRPQARTTVAQARAGSDRGAGAGAVPGALFRSECTALSREAGDRASDSAQLQLGERDSARSGVGGPGAQARSAPQTTATTAIAGDAAAHRRQPAPLVGRRAMARSDRDSG